MPKQIQRAIDEHPDFGQTQCCVGQQHFDELFSRFASIISGTLSNTHTPAIAPAKSCGRSFCLQKGNALKKSRVISFNRRDSTREHSRERLGLVISANTSNGTSKQNQFNHAHVHPRPPDTRPHHAQAPPQPRPSSHQRPSFVHHIGRIFEQLVHTLVLQTPLFAKKQSTRRSQPSTSWPPPPHARDTLKGSPQDLGLDEAKRATRHVKTNEHRARSIRKTRLKEKEKGTTRARRKHGKKKRACRREHGPLQKKKT